jgi:hypothetical protein
MNAEIMKNILSLALSHYLNDIRSIGIHPAIELKSTRDRELIEADIEKDIKETLQYLNIDKIDGPNFAEWIDKHYGIALPKNDMATECYSCRFRRNIPGDCHIMCINPDKNMNGNPHGIKNGWFAYPFNFDPIWKDRLCFNYERKEV